MTTTGRWRGAAVAASLLLTPAALAGCAHGHVAMPATAASPADVVGVYLDALNAEDCDTATALWAAHDAAGSTWCGHVTVTDVTLGSVRPDGCCGRSERFAESVVVDVRFTTHGGDVSLPDGDTTWGYVLVRDADTDPWRIVDEGD